MYHKRASSISDACLAEAHDTENQRNSILIKQRTLAIDASSVNTGWSILEDNDLIVFGEIRLNPKRDKHLQLFNALLGIIQEHKPASAVLEATFMRNVLTLKTLERMRGVAILACTFSGITDIQEFNASSVRKRVFGNGALKKEEVCKLLSAHFKTELKTKGYDASDSVALGCAAHEIKIGQDHNGRATSLPPMPRVRKPRKPRKPNL